MPSVSQRGRNIKHSPIKSLVPVARSAMARGIQVLHLNIGQPDIPSPSSAITALQSYDKEIIAYGASEGSSVLRKTVRDYYCAEVAEIALDDILITTGASEAIIFALFSCFDEGEEVIIPEPFYANYIGFAQMSGVKMIPVTSYIKDGFSLPDPSHFEDKLTSRTKAILFV